MVALRFRRIPTTRLHSGTLLKTEEVDVLPICIGRCTSRIRKGNTLRSECNLADDCHITKHGGEGGGPTDHQSTIRKLEMAEYGHGLTGRL